MVQPPIGPNAASPTSLYDDRRLGPAAYKHFISSLPVVMDMNQARNRIKIPIHPPCLNAYGRDKAPVPTAKDGQFQTQFVDSLSV